MGVSQVSEQFRSPTIAYEAPTVKARTHYSEDVANGIYRRRRVLFGTLLVLYALGFSNQWRVDPDSALYLSVGRNVALGHGYTYHGKTHHLAYPGLPCLFAGAFRMFGTNSLLPHHLLMLLIGFAALALTFRLFHFHADRRTATIVTLLVGASLTFFRYSFELLSDMPFLLAVLAFLVGYDSIIAPRSPTEAQEDSTPGPADPTHDRARTRWFDWLLLMGGLAVAVTTRPAMWALLIAVVGAVVWMAVRGPIRWGLVSILVAVVAAAIAFYKLDPRHTSTQGIGGYEQALLDLASNNFHTLLHKAIAVNLPKIFEPTAAEAFFGLDLGFGVNTLASIAVLFLVFTLFRERVLWGLLVVVTLLMMVAVEIHVRYLLAVLPLLVYAGWQAIVRLDHRLPAPWGRRAFAALLLLFVILNVIKIGGFIMDQRRVPFLDSYKEGKLAAAPEVAEMIRRKTPDVAWVLVARKSGRILSYLSGKYCLEPTDATRLDPDKQAVYVLQPLDETSSKWMVDERIALGPEVGSVLNHKGGGAQVLYRALRSHPDPHPEARAAP